MWKFIDGAKTAGELYGRALVVIAAEQYASRLVLPASQRGARSPWPSRKDIAAKALKKLAGPHLPASLSALERAVKRAHAAYEEAEQAQRREPSEDTVADIEPTSPVAVTDADDENAKARGVLSEEERAERRRADRAFAAQAVEQLRSSEGWQQWLTARRHFHAYRLANQLLIAMQRATSHCLLERDECTSGPADRVNFTPQRDTRCVTTSVGSGSQARWAGCHSTATAPDRLNCGSRATGGGGTGAAPGGAR